MIFQREKGKSILRPGLERSSYMDACVHPPSHKLACDNSLTIQCLGTLLDGDAERKPFNSRKKVLPLPCLTVAIVRPHIARRYARMRYVNAPDLPSIALSLVLILFYNFNFSSIFDNFLRRRSRLCHLIDELFNTIVSLALGRIVNPSFSESTSLPANLFQYSDLLFQSVILFCIVHTTHTATPCQFVGYDNILLFSSAGSAF